MKKLLPTAARNPSPGRQRALEVLALVHQGVSKTEISRCLQLDRSTIDRVIETERNGGTAKISIDRLRGKEVERRRKRIELVQQLAKAKKAISRPEIARRLDVSPSTVRWDLSREPPPTSRTQRDLAALGRIEQRQKRASLVRALSVKGMSQSAIARSLGISRWTVKNDLSEDQGDHGAAPNYSSVTSEHGRSMRAASRSRTSRPSSVSARRRFGKTWRPVRARRNRRATPKYVGWSVAGLASSKSPTASASIRAPSTAFPQHRTYPWRRDWGPRQRACGPRA